MLAPGRVQGFHGSCSLLAMCIRASFPVAAWLFVSDMIYSAQEIHITMDKHDGAVPHSQILEHAGPATVIAASSWSLSFCTVNLLHFPAPPKLFQIEPLLQRKLGSFNISLESWEILQSIRWDF